MAHNQHGVTTPRWRRLPTELREREPHSDDLNAALIHCADGEVEVPQEHIGGHSGTCLAANALQTPMRSHAPKDPCPRATCAVVAKAVEWTATPAYAGGQWERKVEAMKKEW